MAHTAREALVAEMLGDIDVLLSRSEALPAKIAAVEAQLAASTAILDAAGDRYRMTMTAFTEQAKAELTTYLQRKAVEASEQLIEEQRQAIQKTVSRALESMAGNASPTWHRIAETAAIAFLASGLTAAALHWIR